MIMKKMKEYLDKKLIVLCGHTHGNGIVQIAPNILVKTGSAQYRYPKIQEMLTIG